MKYTWRIITVSILIFTSAIFKINVYLTLGYLPPSEWILTLIFIFPIGWIGLQIDKAKYYAKELEKKDKVISELLESVEKQLEETEQRFKSLFVHNVDAIFTFSLEGKLIDANHAAEKLLGYSIEQLKEIDWESILVPDDLELHRKNFILGNEGKQQECTVRFIHKDGNEKIIELKMIPIFIEHQLIGIYEIAKDITDSKLAEEMLRRSDKLSLVGQLAAGVAHEIRNPLTTLKGFVQLVRPNIDKRYADIMLSELERINLIVSEFLILSKPQAIKFAYRDIKEILESTISLLEPQAIIKNIQFRLLLSEQIPLIKCEENQLKQVFINILKNAIEAMPDGGMIKVDMKVKNEMVIIRIIDEGIGIDVNQLPKIGEPFFSTKANGTGLGLMVSFRIIEQHDGQIQISSKLNKGTTIEIKLPIK